MKSACCAVVAGAVLMALISLLFTQNTPAYGQRSGGFDSPELITLATPVGDARQQLTVIDPRARVLTVYHVELATGLVTLKSVRNLHWDLQMSEFNAQTPLPREIRAMVEQR